MITHLSVWGIILAAVSALVIGSVWYAKPLFGNSWMKAIGISDKDMKKSFSMAMPILVVVSLITAYVLALFIKYFHDYHGGSWYKAGVLTALLAWVGLAGSALVAHEVFEKRPKSVVFINLGNRLVTLLAMGLIIAAFMS
jgi:uncharacterized membrane protein